MIRNARHRDDTGRCSSRVRSPSRPDPRAHWGRSKAHESRPSSEQRAELHVLEPTGGLEPPTARLQVGCATSCATPAGHGNKSRDKSKDNAGDDSAAPETHDLDREIGFAAGSLRLWAAARHVTGFATRITGVEVAGIDPFAFHRQVTRA